MSVHTTLKKKEPVAKVDGEEIKEPVKMKQEKRFRQREITPKRKGVRETGKKVKPEKWLSLEVRQKNETEREENGGDKWRRHRNRRK